jgi:ketosteroid isomerase-like protein
MIEMRISNQSISLAAAGLVFGVVAARPVRAQSHDEHLVRGVIEAIATFSQAKNVAGLDTLYAPDAWVRIIEGSGANNGWTDYRDRHLAPELAEMQNFRYRYYDIEPQVRGNVAWAAFRYELIADTPQGHVELDGRGTAILEKRGARWLVVQTHTSGRRRTQRP